MQNQSVVWFMLLLALCALGALLLVRYGVKHYANPQGKGAEKKTRRALVRFARFHRGKVLSQVLLPFDQGGKAVENLLIAPFGILLVHTCGKQGEYYGQIDAAQWTLLQGEQKSAIANPVRELEQATAALRDLFAKEKVFKVPIEQIVYIPSRSKRTAVYIKNNGQILHGASLGAYLSKTRYQQDQGVDPVRVSEVIARAGQ